MAHTHYTINTKLKLAIVANIVFTVIEFFAGIYSGSLALTADAVYGLTDVTSLTVSLVARIFSKRPTSARKTFGYQRAPIIAALINACLLFFLAFSLLYGAYQRWQEPQQIESGIVIIMALLGTIINAGSALLFLKDRQDINISSAFLNLSFDALASVAALVTGIIIMFTGSVTVDTVISSGLAILLVISAVKLAQQALHVLLEGVPEHIKLEQVQEYLRTVPGVRDVHDLHIWGLSSDKTVLICHLVLDTGMSNQQDIIKQAIKQELYKRFSIEHSTLETEYTQCTQKSCVLHNFN